jgi:predicted O-linked N-acetylglucosamine transferase (SPINDLY family)
LTPAHQVQNVSHNPVAGRIRRLIDAKKWKQAWAELKPLLANEPTNPTFRWVAGLLESELKHPDEALAHLRYAAEHIEDEPDLFHRLGELEQAAGNVAAAEHAFERAIAMQSGVPRLLEYAALMESQGKVARAIELLEEAYAIEPTNHDVVFKLAYLHHCSFDPTPALVWAMRAVKLKQDHWDSYLLLGTILQRLGHLQEAVELYQSLLLMRPDYPSVNQNLGMLCVPLGLNTEAIRYFKRALESEPKRLDLESRILQQYLFLNDWSEIAPRAESLLKRLRSTVDVVSPFAMLSIPGVTANDLKISAERMALPMIKTAQPYVHQFQRTLLASDGERRLKIGYLSCDFYEHATAYLMARLFELHDRSQFETYAYSWSKDSDSPLRKRVTAAFDVYRDIRGLTDLQAAEQIHRDEVDILIDLKGYTFDGRLTISAFRPAPVTVHHVGFPGTIGAPFIDYLVADRIVAPPEHPEFFTEKIAYLPDCYQPTDETREIGERPPRTACGLPETGIVFCCFNQTYKFTPDVYDIWCRLLRDVEGSVLWLILRSPKTIENLRAETARRGVDPSRLVIAPPMLQTAHLGRLQNADIVLDTLPVNAHTTASDALWVGVPIVTLPGEPFVSRVASSILTTAGLPELVAKDFDDYYRIAKELATNQTYLEQIKLRVREGGRKSPLFESVRYTRHLETLYRIMWRRRVAGLPPVTLDINGALE